MTYDKPKKYIIDSGDGQEFTERRDKK